MKIKNKRIKLVGGLRCMKKAWLSLKTVEMYEKSINEVK
jgi:hypothetical protein